MTVPVLEWLHWAAGYGLPRASLKLLARRGDPFAQLLTLDTNRADNIYPLIEQVRERGRMSPVKRVGWVTADAQIAREVLRDSRFRTLKPRDLSPFRFAQWILAKTAHDEPPPLLFTDPPEHTQLRRRVSRALAPRALDGLRTRIHEIADGLLRGPEGSAECDLIAEYTSQMPIAVIAEMLAIPRDGTCDLHAVVESISTLLGTPAASWRDFRAATKTLSEFDLYLEQHIEQLRQDDDANSILSDVIHDSDLTQGEITMLAGLLFGAGFDFGNAVVALVRHPDQLAALCANPEGWPSAIEEILRYAAAGQMLVRVATEDVDIQGYPVRAGERIFLLIGGANRDPAVFEHPDTFDTTRTNAREHISFGSGVHACLGAALARMQLHIGLQSLFEHFPQLTLAGEPTFNELHGLKHLPVSLQAANVIVP